MFLWICKIVKSKEKNLVFLCLFWFYCWLNSCCTQQKITYRYKGLYYEIETLLYKYIFKASTLKVTFLRQQSLVFPTFVFWFFFFLYSALNVLKISFEISLPWLSKKCICGVSSHSCLILSLTMHWKFKHLNEIFLSLLWKRIFCFNLWPSLVFHLP